MSTLPPSPLDPRSSAGLPRHRGAGDPGPYAWPPEHEAQDGASPTVARRLLPAGGPPAPTFGFELEVEHHADTVVLRLAGEFDLACVNELEGALTRGVRRFTRHVVFDLSAVSFLDMAGLMCLIRADDESRHASFDVQVVPPTGIASRVFTLTSAGERLTMVAAAPPAESV